MNVGEAFYLNVADSHRYFVVFITAFPSRKVVVFNFSSHRPGKCDETCIVTPSEYLGIDHDSIVAYAYGDVLEGPSLSVFQGTIGRPLPSLDNRLVGRILDGALTSRHTKLKIKRVLRP